MTYTETIAPRLDPTRDRLSEILAARHINIDLVNEDTGDPQNWASIIRRSVERNAETIPQRYRNAVAQTPELRTWVDALVAQAHHRVVRTVTRGPSLLLLGPTGVGKTYETYGALRDLAVTGVACEWITTTAPDLYAALRPRHQVDHETEFRRYANADLLVLDDIGAAKGSEWTEEINYRIINHRYEAERPMLITSNVPTGQLGAALGDRVASRLTEMCQRVVLTGTDRRRSRP